MFKFREIKRSRFNGHCIDYSKSKIDKLCLSQIECLDQCFVREFFLNTNFSYYGKIINKKHFDNYEWNKLIFKSYTSNLNFNDQKIKEKCEKIYKLPDCFEVYFKLDHCVIFFLIVQQKLKNIIILN